MPATMTACTPLVSYTHCVVHEHTVTWHPYVYRYSLTVEVWLSEGSLADAHQHTGERELAIWTECVYKVSRSQREGGCGNESMISEVGRNP